MKLNKTAKILVGLGTAWITLYPLLFFAAWLMMMLGIGLAGASGRGDPPPFFVIPFIAIMPLQCLTILLLFGMITFYVAHAVKNTVASEAVRIILAVGTFFIPFIAMPVYYYLYIWQDTPPSWALEPH